MLFSMMVGQHFSQRVGYAAHVMCYMAQTAGKGGLTTVAERFVNNECGVIESIAGVPVAPA